MATNAVTIVEEVLNVSETDNNIIIGLKLLLTTTYITNGYLELIDTQISP